MTKIDLITGILGSGKTTFILGYARYLLSNGKRIAILENDFGAVNADMLMLQPLKSENCQLEMVSGGCDPDCHRRRFKTQLIALGMQHFDRVIVEPSGIFDMDEFFDILHESPLDKWFEVGSVLTIADAGTPDDLTPQMEYLFASEAACCGKLIVSKLGSEQPEKVTERLLGHLERSFSAIKCDRTLRQQDVLTKGFSELTDADYEMLANSGYRGSRYVKLYSDEDIQSSVHYFMNLCIEEELIEAVINGIFSDSSCGRVYRIKGALPVGEEWLTINADRNGIKTGRLPDGQSVLIFIGDNINREAIDEHLKAVNTDKKYMSI